MQSIYLKLVIWRVNLSKNLHFFKKKWNRGNTENGRLGDWRKTGNDWGMNTLLYVRMQDAGWSVKKLQASKHQASTFARTLRRDKPEKLQKPNREPGGPPVLFRLGGCQTALRYRLAKAAGIPPQSKTISGGKLRPYPASGRGCRPNRFSWINRFSRFGIGLESVYDIRILGRKGAKNRFTRFGTVYGGRSRKPIWTSEPTGGGTGRHTRGRVCSPKIGSIRLYSPLFGIIRLFIGGRGKGHSEN
jgi:hypothetical protein